MNKKHNSFDVYTIIAEDNVTSASFVAEKGGVGSSLIMPDQGNARELLFQHTHFWERGNKHIPGGWPFLFPVCARLERNNIAGDYLYDGKVYNLPIHGFAPYLSWQVAKHTKNSITLVLRATPQTLAMYPFNFCVELTYKVVPKLFICEQRYTNIGEKPMPYYAGFHPYFLTPRIGEGKEKVAINFKAKRHFKCNEKLTDIIGEQPLLAMPAFAADANINEQLSELAEDSSIQLSYPDGFVVNISIEETPQTPRLFNYLQIYTQPQEPFICLEPWMAFPNALNTVQGVRWLAPQQSDFAVLKVSSFNS